MKGVAILLIALIGYALADPIDRAAQCPAVAVTGDQGKAMTKFNQLMDVTSKVNFFFYNDNGVDAAKSKFVISSTSGNVYENNPDGLGDYNITITLTSNTGGKAVFNVKAQVFLAKAATGAVVGVPVAGQALDQVASAVPVPMAAQYTYVFASGKLTFQLPSCTANVPVGSSVSVSDLCNIVFYNHHCNVFAKTIADQMSKAAV